MLQYRAHTTRKHELLAILHRMYVPNFHILDPVDQLPNHMLHVDDSLSSLRRTGRRSSRTAATPLLLLDFPTAASPLPQAPPPHPITARFDWRIESGCETRGHCSVSRANAAVQRRRCAPVGGGPERWGERAACVCVPAGKLRLPP